MIQSVWKNLTGLQKAAEHLWCDFKWDKNSSPNTNDLYIHYMDKSTGTPPSLEEKKVLPNCGNKDGNIIHLLKNYISTSVATVFKCMTWRCRVSGLITCLCCLCVVVSCAWFVLTARHVRCLLYCFHALLVLRSLAHLVPHLVLIISLASLYSSLCFSVFCQTVVGFFPLALTVLLTSRLVLSGSSARSCFCVSLHPLCASRYRGLPPTPAVPGYLRTRCGLLSLSLGLASSLAGFIASAAVTARHLVHLLSNKTSAVPASESCLSYLTEQSDQRLIQRDRIRFALLSCNREHCWVSIVGPPSSTPQRMRWMLSMPESQSSSRGSMIFSGRRLTVVPPSVLAFLWNPNRMPTIHLLTIATQIPAKPFSASVRWCFHCSRDVIAPKKQRWHSFSLFSQAAPANGESLFGDCGLPAVLHLPIFARRWRSFSTDQPRGIRRRLSCLGCHRGSVLSPTIPFSFRL